MNLDAALTYDLLKQQLDHEFNPQQLDTNTVALTNALQKLWYEGFWRSFIEDSWAVATTENPSRLKINARNYEVCEEALAQYSGSLAFLHGQTVSAIGLLKSSEKERAATMITDILEQGKLMGVGFSQLRRQDPTLRASMASPSHYEISGTIPWVSGLGAFKQVLVAATLDSGESLFFVLPLDLPQVEISILPVATMSSVVTAELTLAKIELPKAHVLLEKPRDWIHDRESDAPIEAGYIFGTAMAALEQLIQHLPVKDLQAGLDSFRREVARSAEKTPEEKSRLRARLLAFVHLLTQMCVEEAGGKGTLLTHPAQRIAREALFYQVYGQSKEARLSTRDVLKTHALFLVQAV